MCMSIKFYVFLNRNQTNLKKNHSDLTTCLKNTKRIVKKRDIVLVPDKVVM